MTKQLLTSAAFQHQCCRIQIPQTLPLPLMLVLMHLWGRLNDHAFYEPSSRRSFYSILILNRLHPWCEMLKITLYKSLKIFRKYLIESLVERLFYFKVFTFVMRNMFLVSDYRWLKLNVTRTKTMELRTSYIIWVCWKRLKF